MSFGQTLSAHQLQLGPLGADTVLSTVVQPVQDVSIGERTGGETSHTSSREHGCDNNAGRDPPAGASDSRYYVHNEKRVGDTPEVTSLRCVPEGVSSADNQAQDEGPESENPSETGADAGEVDDPSSNEEG